MRREKAKVENPVVRRALSELGVPSIPIKLVAGSDTGRPDDLFLIPGGRGLFIEFKDPEGAVEPKQVYWHKILRDLGYEVEVHDEVETAMEAIRQATARAEVSVSGAKNVARRKRH